MRQLFWYIRKTAKATINFVMSVSPRVRSSAWNNSIPGFSLNFDILVFFLNLSRNFKVH